MSRVASVVLLFGGAVLCVTWLVSPAASAPQSAPTQTLEASERVAEELGVEQIHLDTVAVDRRYLAPRRNPFSFETRESSVPRAVVPPAVVAPVHAPVLLPTLVAIVKESTPDGDAYRAALSTDGFGVTIVAAGQTFAGFSVVAVRADVVSLRQAASGESFDVRLR